MLTNQAIRNVANDLDRRWISDDYFDLIVWYETEVQIHGFQLCYDKPGRERALTWTRERGFLHTAVDSGESKPTANRTPIVVADGTFPAGQVRREFIARSGLLPAEIRELVLARIKDYEDRQSA
ncbi:MAG: hypothetical protein ABIS50_26615 [Luteolibacter sp.]|uniref:hypothetical protein n=1 Tax=Luteolibacter sp. TaxID=1962973 RepID=UPI00326388D8